VSIGPGKQPIRRRSAPNQGAKQHCYPGASGKEKQSAEQPRRRQQAHAAKRLRHRRRSAEGSYTDKQPKQTRQRVTLEVRGWSSLEMALFLTSRICAA
jgi:hypothetical protein